MNDVVCREEDQSSRKSSRSYGGVGSGGEEEDFCWQMKQELAGCVMAVDRGLGPVSFDVAVAVAAAKMQVIFWGWE